MEQLKELSKKYTQDYALDDQTRTRAEELYREFYIRNSSKDPSVSQINWSCTFVPVGKWQKLRHSIPLLFLVAFYYTAFIMRENRH